MSKKVRTFQMETVTPEKAEQWLKTNHRNRKLSRIVVNRYAGDMARGEWQWNGEAIKFDTRGRLLDGQHRLHAVVVSGIAIEIGVFRGMPPETFQTLDTGKNRTPGDILSTYGHKNPNELGGAARLLYFYGDERWAERRVRMTNTRLVKLLDAHPDLVACADAVMVKPLKSRLLPGSVNIFVYYCASQVDAEKANRFFRELASGRFTRGSDAVYTLRERLIETSQEYVKPSTNVKIAWTVVAWNHFYAGRKLSRLARTYTDLPRFTPEPFA